MRNTVLQPTHGQHKERQDFKVVVQNVTNADHGGELLLRAVASTRKLFPQLHLLSVLHHTLRFWPGFPTVRHIVILEVVFRAIAFGNTSPMRSILLLLLLPVTALAQPGTLDPLFAVGGLRMTDVGFGTYDVGYALAVRPDDSFIVAGTSGYETSWDLCAARYLPNGSLDTDFGGDGLVTLSINPGDDIARAVAVQPDGKVLLGGYTYTDLGIGFALARLTVDGLPDDSFGDNGHVVTVTPGDVTLQARALGVQADGRILLAGGGAEGFAIMRYTETGVPDSTFDDDGLVTIDFSDGNDQCTALAVQPDGRILLVGYASGQTADSVALARLLPDGSLDPDFGNGGTLRASYPLLPSMAYALDLMSDGRFVIAGTAGTRAMAARFLPNGAVDNSFNVFGWNFFSFPGGTVARFNGVRVQEDGSIVLGGTSNSNVVDFVVAHLLYDGALNPAFGTDGYTLTNFTGVEDDAYAVGLQSDGGILLAGGSNGVSSDFDLAIARYRPDLTSSIDDALLIDDAFDVWPVPFGRTFTLRIELARAERLAFELVDGSGRRVQQWDLGVSRAGTQVRVMEVGDVAPGLYTLRRVGDAMSARRVMVGR